MKRENDGHDASNGMEIRNQTISGGTQQFSDKIVNIYNLRGSQKLLIVILLLLVLAGIVQGIQYVSQTRQQEQEISTLLATGKRQQDAKDFALAFTTFNQALTVAERKPEGLIAGLLKPLKNEKVRIGQAQAALAMAWLQDGRPGKKTFTEMVDPLLAVLGRAAERTSGSEKADILAHIGWGNFLKSRDQSGARINPEPDYRQALAIDGENTFAHLYLGHWIFWQGDNKDQGVMHLKRAIQSKRASTFAFQMSLAAVKNSRDNPLFLYFANEMQKSNVPLEARDQSSVRFIYSEALRSSERDPGLKKFRLLTETMPAQEHLALIKAMPYKKDHFYGRDLVWDECMAIFTELAGDKKAALAMWQDLAAHVRQSKDRWQTDAWMNQMAQRLEQEAK